ncbi:MAG: SAF domain-containing protein [Cyanobacteriota/Melainabacteria group bacterium]
MVRWGILAVVLSFVLGGFYFLSAKPTVPLDKTKTSTTDPAQLYRQQQNCAAASVETIDIKPGYWGITVKETVPRGTRIESDMLKKEFFKREELPSSFATSLDEVSGKLALRDLVPGKAIQWGDVSPALSLEELEHDL